MTESQEKNFCCGVVSIVGRPNSGKSTLLNQIVGEKVAIVSEVPQTTRHQIRGIYNDQRGQIIFIDTPGLHLSKDKLGALMNSSASRTFSDADCIIHLVDAQKHIGPEEEEIVKRLRALKVPIILGLNKIDIGDKHIPEYIQLWERACGKSVQEMSFLTLLPLSGKKGVNVEKLLEILFAHLPVGPALYPADIISDVPQKMMVADIIREKLFALMREEVPHAIAVVIEKMEQRRKNLLDIQALILVERESQKSIVIGKNGQNLKEAGTLARKELEELLETKIFLEMHVKSKTHWRDNDSLLEELGYSEI